MEKMVDQNRDTNVGGIGFAAPPSVQVQASRIKMDESFSGLLRGERLSMCGISGVCDFPVGPASSFVWIGLY